MYIDERSIVINDIFNSYLKSNRLDVYIKNILEHINFHNYFDVDVKVNLIKKKILKGRIPFDKLMEITYFYENKNENQINYKHYVKISPDISRIINNDYTSSLKIIRKKIKGNIAKIIDKEFLLFLLDNNLEDVEMSIELYN